MAITGKVIDEAHISMVQSGDVTIPVGMPGLIVTAALGSRNALDEFEWDRKEVWILVTQAMYENAVDPASGEKLPGYHPIPDHLFEHFREGLLAVEDYIQTFIGEEYLPAPVDENELKQRKYKDEDPRAFAAWQTHNGHETKPGTGKKVPVTKERIANIKKKPKS